jgi:hypothetical protein
MYAETPIHQQGSHSFQTTGVTSFVHRPSMSAAEMRSVITMHRRTCANGSFTRHYTGCVCFYMGRWGDRLSRAHQSHGQGRATQRATSCGDRTQSPGRQARSLVPPVRPQKPCEPLSVASKCHFQWLYLAIGKHHANTYLNLNLLNLDSLPRVPSTVAD